MRKKIPLDFLATPAVSYLMEYSPLVDVDTNPESLFVFRRLIEASLAQGRWFGHMPLVS